MASYTRYANLGEAPLKVMAQLRGLSNDGAKELLVQRLVAQDIETGAADETNGEAGEATKGANDDVTWEVVGKKRSKRVAAESEIRVPKDVTDVQDTLNVEDMEELNQGGGNDESAADLSSTALTVVEEPSSGLEKTNEVEHEPAEDSQASLILETEQKPFEDNQTSSSQKVKHRPITKKARTLRASPNQFDVLSVEEDDTVESEAMEPAIEPAIDSAMDPANNCTPKKSRKRGKKGGKKVQKAAAKHTQPKHFSHVACAAAVVGIVGVAVGVLVMFA